MIPWEIGIKNIYQIKKDTFHHFEKCLSWNIQFGISIRKNSIGVNLV